MHTKFVSESSYFCFMCDLYGQEAAEDLKKILQEKQLEVESEKPGPHSGQRSSKRARGLGDSESLRSSGHADVPGPDSSPEPPLMTRTKTCSEAALPLRTSHDPASRQHAIGLIAFHERSRRSSATSRRSCCNPYPRTSATTLNASLKLSKHTGYTARATAARPRTDLTKFLNILVREELWNMDVLRDACSGFRGLAARGLCSILGNLVCCTDLQRMGSNC